MATNWAGTYKNMTLVDPETWQRLMSGPHDESIKEKQMKEASYQSGKTATFAAFYSPNVQSINRVKRSNGMSVYLGCAVRQEKDKPLEVLVQPTVLEASSGVALAVLLSRLHDAKVEGKVDYLGVELPKLVTA
jgi:hypothetical protein